MNRQCLAPRDSASNPSAPVPANMSRQRAPIMTGCSQLNIVSLTRSGVGRISGMSLKCNLRLRQWPPIMRTTLLVLFAWRDIVSF